VNAEIVIEVPEELKSLVQAVKDLFAVAISRMRDARGGKAVDYRAVEREVGKKICALERDMHGALLSKLEVDAPRVEIKGKTYARVGEGLGTYFTMAGPVQIKRALYREDGCRNAKTVDAISLRTGAIGDGWLPQTAIAMAHLLQQGTSREAEQTARQLGRLPYSRASFERVPHELGALYLPQQADIEDQLIQALEIPKAACSISVSVDRVSIPMEEPVKRPVGRPRKDAPKNPVSRQFRMAYCATLTLHDAEGESLHTIRYACMPNADAALLTERMTADLQRLLERRPDLRVSVLADGAPEMWNLLGCVSALGIKPMELVDFWHLIEKLRAAAVVIHGEEQATEVIARWKFILRKSSKAVARILAQLEASGCEHKRSGGEQPVHNAITYLQTAGTAWTTPARSRTTSPSGAAMWKPPARRSSVSA
jgi:hypothetical protein